MDINSGLETETGELRLTNDDFLYYDCWLDHPNLQASFIYQRPCLLSWWSAYLQCMCPRLHREHHRYFNDAVRHPPVHAVPCIREVPWRCRGHEVASLGRAIVNLKRYSKWTVVSQTIQRWRDERHDGDVPALGDGVEQIEVILAAMGRSEWSRPAQNVKTHMLGPLPAVKLSSLPPRGHGVTPDSVFPIPGNSVHVRPETLVFRDACAASMDTVPSPSTKPARRSLIHS